MLGNCIDSWSVPSFLFIVITSLVKRELVALLFYVLWYVWCLLWIVCLTSYFLWMWLFLNIFDTIEIEHGFSCINIRQVPWEVLKTEAGGHGLQHLPRDLANVNALKNHVRSLLLHKTINICYNLHYFLHYFVLPFHRCLANAISTDYARSRAGQYTSCNGSNLWPRYDHIESCAAVHKQRVNRLVNTRLFAG